MMNALNLLAVFPPFDYATLKFLLVVVALALTVIYAVIVLLSFRRRPSKKRKSAACAAKCAKKTDAKNAKKKTVDAVEKEKNTVEKAKNAGENDAVANAAEIAAASAKTEAVKTVTASGGETGKTSQEPDDVLLDVKHLKKYFPIEKSLFGKTLVELKAVDDVSFQVRRGKTLGIVGESGCGKTTMGRTILRLYDVTGGQIMFKGRDITALSDKEFNKLRPHMQMIFQDPYASLSPRMSVGEIIGEAALEHKIVDKAHYREYVLGVMEKCGLRPHYYERYPHEFSGGQRQRICIARVLAIKPELVICDEPVSALDVSIQAQIINMLKDLQRDFGLTYIFISHDLSVVKHISDEVGVMYLGSMVEYGPKSRIFDRPLHPYTKALFSAVPVPNTHVKMNRIILKGDIPSPVNPPKGCKFHTRCENCMEICSKVKPIYREIEEGHFCACHLYNTPEETSAMLAEANASTEEKSEESVAEK